MQADSSPWNGTWKIDTAQGNLVGDTFSYTELANGRWQVSSGGAVAFQFVPDGNPYQTTDPDNSVRVTRESNNVLIFHRLNKGREWDTMREELSADGNRLLDTDNEVLEDGGKNIVRTTYVRVGEGKGFAGKWKSVKLSAPHIHWIFPWSYVMTTTGPDTVKWELPSDHITVEGRTDGSPITLSPAGATPTVAVEIKKDSSRQFSLDITIDGHPVKRSLYKLSSDGKSFSQDSWDPAKPNEVRTAVFVKQ
ncbi:MAG TPA: hypothetical protein VKV05_07815 [Terriglobales bacterium]|nr:hypothetical protein [Terriglobales bacterium]